VSFSCDLVIPVVDGIVSICMYGRAFCSEKSGSGVMSGPRSDLNFFSKIRLKRTK
jgi:hypothetical protein